MLFFRAGKMPILCRATSGKLVLRGGSDAAATVLNQSIHSDEKFNESKLVEVFNSASNCDTLEQMYKSVLDRNPAHVPTLHNYGNLLMKVRHNYTEAEARYKAVLTLDPHHVPSLCNYGNLLHNHLSNSVEAESMYLKALNSDPTHSTTLCNYGLFVQNVKRNSDEAESLYRKALDSDPQHSTTLYNYGRLIQVYRLTASIALYTLDVFQQDANRNVSEAESLFQRALERDPEHVAVLCSYGLLRLNAYRDADGAEALYRRALAVDPVHVATLYNYGSLLEGVRQNFSGAVAMYQQVALLVLVGFRSFHIAQDCCHPDFGTLC